MENKIANIKERVLLLAESQSIGREKFFEKIGMSYGSFKGKAKNTPLNSDAVANIVANFPDVNPAWLISGEGKMLLSEMGDKQPYYKERRGKKLADASEDIPVYYGNTRGGNLQVYSDDPSIEHPVGVLSKTIFPGCDHAEKVTGDSMYPLIINQGIIVGKIIDKRGIIYGEKYGIHTKYGQNVAKFLHKGTDPGYVKLVSYNKSIPDQDIPVDDITECFRIIFIINPA